MTTRVVSIGVEIRDPRAESLDITSRASLLDFDVSIFRPDIFDYVDGATDYYCGLPSLSELRSFAFQQDCNHWTSEISAALQAGKLVVVFCCAKTELYVDSGQKEYSGTGRNRQTTRLVSESSNYHLFLPSLKVRNAVGTEMKLQESGKRYLSRYWSRFSQHSYYMVEVVFEKVKPTITTKTGDRPLGYVLTSKGSPGKLFLLPDIPFENDQWFVASKDGKRELSKHGKSLHADLITEFLDIYDTHMRSDGESPPPEWVNDTAFLSVTERAAVCELLKIESEIERIHERKRRVQEKAKEFADCRKLLYGTGHGLETAIIKALNILGFSAKNFKDADSEFDVVFESSEGRLIGEAEGKDSKAVAIEKVRQLLMNIEEDYAKRDGERAKGVIFGNACRRDHPSKRNLDFTQKCYDSAREYKFALVRTPDLYASALYVHETADVEYATLCRKVIVESIGLVVFPAIPERNNTQEVQVSSLVSENDKSA